MFPFDDVIMHFPSYRHFPCYRSPVDSSHKGEWRGALMSYLICAWKTKRLSKQSGCRWVETPCRSLWRRCNVHWMLSIQPQESFTCNFFLYYHITPNYNTTVCNVTISLFKPFQVWSQILNSFSVLSYHLKRLFHLFVKKSRGTFSSSMFECRNWCSGRPVMRRKYITPHTEIKGSARTFKWRHNERVGVSNHRRLHCSTVCSRNGCRYLSWQNMWVEVCVCVCVCVLVSFVCFSIDDLLSLVALFDFQQKC